MPYLIYFLFSILLPLVLVVGTFLLTGGFKRPKKAIFIAPGIAAGLVAVSLILSFVTKDYTQLTFVALTSLLAISLIITCITTVVFRFSDKRDKKKKSSGKHPERLPDRRQTNHPAKRKKKR